MSPRFDPPLDSRALGDLELLRREPVDLSGTACPQCGSIMQQTGHCFTCPECGHNDGCG